MHYVLKEGTNNTHAKRLYIVRSLPRVVGILLRAAEMAGGPTIRRRVCVLCCVVCRRRFVTLVLKIIYCTCLLPLWIKKVLLLCVCMCVCVVAHHGLPPVRRPGGWVVVRLAGNVSRPFLCPARPLRGVESQAQQPNEGPVFFTILPLSLISLLVSPPRLSRHVLPKDSLMLAPAPKVSQKTLTKSFPIVADASPRAVPPFLCTLAQHDIPPSRTFPHPAVRSPVPKVAQASDMLVRVPGRVVNRSDSVEQVTLGETDTTSGTAGGTDGTLAGHAFVVRKTDTLAGLSVAETFVRALG